MDRQHSRGPRNIPRHPLTDATSRVNNAQPALEESRPDQHSSPGLPHHESLKPEGNLHLLNASSPLPSTVGNPRLSAVIDSQQHNSNRNSQVSTVSTNASGKSRRKVAVGPWILGKTLGVGATARVRQAKHAVTGQLAAVKIVAKNQSIEVNKHTSLQHVNQIEKDPQGARQMPFGLEREIVIMKLIEHPNVISLYDVWENRGEL